MNNKFKLNDGSGNLCCKGCGRQDRQLNTYDWLADIPGNAEEQDLVEVQFKNTRKGYYKNSNHLKLEKGDIVAVEATPGHDIGVVTLTGRLVPLQMRKANLKSDTDIKRIYRKAKPVDMEKYEEAKAKEHETMIRSRQIALNLNLNMKIGDVEYQGDGNKAIFYYIADERVDFRQLIKVLAEAFRVRIEMKQIPGNLMRLILQLHLFVFHIGEDLIQVVGIDRHPIIMLLKCTGIILRINDQRLFTLRQHDIRLHHRQHRINPIIQSPWNL